MNFTPFQNVRSQDFLAAASSSFSIGASSMAQDLHCTELQAALGLSLFAMGFAIVPLVTSSFSEVCYHCTF